MNDVIIIMSAIIPMMERRFIYQPKGMVHYYGNTFQNKQKITT